MECNYPIGTFKVIAVTVKIRDSSRRDGGKCRLDRACGLDKQVAGEMAHSRSNLEVKLQGCLKHWMWGWGKERNRGA